jgi:hypothetical protein
LNQSRRRVVFVDRADELRRFIERRVVAIDLDHREDRGERDLRREEVSQLLLDQVPDHPLRLRPEDVERIRLDVLVGGCLEGEQPDLRTVAVGQHHLVVLGHWSDRPGRGPDVVALHVDGHRFTALEQGVATESDEDAHRLPLNRRASPGAAP